VLSLQTFAISDIKHKHTDNICYTGKLYFSNEFSLHIRFFFTQKVKPHTCSKMHSVLYDTVTTCAAHGIIWYHRHWAWNLYRCAKSITSQNM